MKYLKQFEDYFQEYNVGDYVLLNLDEVNKEWKIVDNNGNFIIDDTAIIEAALIDYYEIKFSDDDTLHVKEKCIKRLLTPEEINKFNLKKDTKKYNL